MAKTNTQGQGVSPFKGTTTTTTADNSFANPQSILLQNKTGSIDTAQIVKAVINDMVSAERGGQWILSSYAPYKDKGPFPGFEDFSMEEIRFMFYQARSSNTLEQYKQQVQGLLQQSMMKIRALQNPSPEIVNMLRSIYNAAPSTNVQQQQFAGQPGASSIFGGGANQQKSIFNNSPAPSQAIFGGGGGAPSQSIFASPASPPIFGGATPNPSAFSGGTNTQASPFGVSPQVGSSIFGGGGGAPNNSIFGGSGTQQQQQQQQQSTSSIFGGNPSTNPIFASPLQSAQPVATAHSNSIFGGQPSFPQPPQYEAAKPQLTQQQAFIIQQNARGGFFPPQAPENSQQAFQHSNNIFGNLVQQQQQQQQLSQQQQQLPQQQQQQQQPLLHQQLQMQPQQGPQQHGLLQQRSHQNDNPFIEITDENYSKAEDLTESEIAWFRNDDLDIDNIPVNPPTREMCF